MDSPMLPVFVCVSQSHRQLFENHFKPTFEKTAGHCAELRVIETRQACQSGVLFSDGWKEQVSMKVEAMLQACVEKLFVFSDADVVFLDSWVDLAVNCLGEDDLAWMGEPCFSPAFFIARGSLRLAAMFKKSLVDGGKWRGDGEAIHHALQTSPIKHHRLPDAFSNPGRLGFPIPLLDGRATFRVRDGMRVFHGNFCTLKDKSILLQDVRQQHEKLRRVGLGFFPPERPERPFDRQSMLRRDKMRDILAAVGNRPITLIIEIGSWLGGSTRWFLESFGPATTEGGEAGYARIICIDPWTGVPEYEFQAELASRMLALWEQWCANCWEWRHSITPVRLKSREGIPAIAKELLRQKEQPDLIYIDGDHTERECFLDIMECAGYWPEALLMGDGYFLVDEAHGRCSVEKAVTDAAGQLGRKVQVGRSGTWWFEQESQRASGKSGPSKTV